MKKASQTKQQIGTGQSAEQALGYIDPRACCSAVEVHGDIAR